MDVTRDTKNLRFNLSLEKAIEEFS